MTCVLFAALVLLADAGASSGESARTDLYGDPLPPGVVARLGTIRLRHSDADVKFSKDGKRLISCGCDGELRIWDVATGRLLRRKQLVKMAKKSREDQLLQVGLSSNGAMAAASSNHMVYLYDTATGKEYRRFPIRAYCDKLLLFSPDGKSLAVQEGSAQDYFVTRLWDIAGVKKRQTLEEDSREDRLTDRLTNIAFAPDGKRLAGATAEGDLFLWDAATGKVLGEKKGPPTDDKEEFPVAFSPDGKILAFVSRLKVRLLNAANLKERARLEVPADVKDGDIERLAFSPDGRVLAAAYSELPGRAEQGGVLLWRTTGTKEAQRLPDRRRYDTRLNFAPDGATLACHDSAGSEIRLWDVASGRPLPHPPGHDRLVRTIAVSPDGKTIASGDLTPTLRLWDAATGKPLRALRGDDDWTHACLFSPDGKRLISAGVVGTFQVWDAASGKELRRFEIDWPDRGLVELHAVGISADGKRLTAIASGGQRSHPAQVLVWDITTGKLQSQQSYRLEVRSYGKPPIPWLFKAHAAIAPDGERMSVWLGKQVGIEEIATKCLLATLPQGVGAPLVFSPDGRLLAAAILQPKQDPSDGDDVIGLLLIEAATGGEVFRRKIDGFEYAAFAPDGRSVVVVDDKNLSVWDTSTGERLYQMAWPESIVSTRREPKIHSLAVLPGGRAATGMSEGDILIWDLAPSAWPVRRSQSELDRKKLDALWSDLAGEARPAYRAIHRMTATPAQTVPYLNDRLQPVALDAKRIEKLLADLDGEQFEAREAASRELTRLHYQAEPMLRRALEGRPSLEMRRRLQSILAEPRHPPVEALRTLRAIAVLERIGTPEARRILEKLSGGAEAHETRDAKAALQRLKRLPP